MLLECDGRFTGQFCFKRSLFESYKEIPFEDTEFQVPSGYEGYLEKAYDDYMQLPPESEREKGHHIIFCDLKMDYEKYFVNDQKGNV